ncbi:MAG: leucyl/phenylalanyl-tRNA--protein transferase [Chloroflexi bacterium]|nr:leucyl/phenylalanyl-tRNA--protein transferase [Chloroflexota bacterium]
METRVELTPELLLSAYCQGIFPMAHDDGNIYWYDPDPRAIIPLDEFHVSRSLRRTLGKRPFTIRINTAFVEVMHACAAPNIGRESTWISDEIILAYTRLHRLGFAHSVETWLDGKLVGGLYGVAVRGLFAGESMFSHITDGSKVALAHLVTQMRQQGLMLLDIQFMTDHLMRFGAIEVSSQAYKRLLAAALQAPAQFTNSE